MGDQQQATLGRAHRVDSVRHHLERVDVEAGIRLVENRQTRLQRRHLQDLHALLLATGEARVHRPLEHVVGDAEVAGPGRSEEHTSELQSLMRISYAVFCLKKKTTTKT